MVISIPAVGPGSAFWQSPEIYAAPAAALGSSQVIAEEGFKPVRRAQAIELEIEFYNHRAQQVEPVGSCEGTRLNVQV